MIDRSRISRALDLLGNAGRIHARLQPIGTGWLCNEMIDLDNTVSQDIIVEPKRWKLVKAKGATPVKAVNNFLKILPRRVGLQNDFCSI